MFNQVLRPPGDAEKDMWDRDRQELARAAAHLEARPGMFVGVSLGAWLKEVVAARVAHVPAKHIFTMERRSFMDFERSLSTEHTLWSGLRKAIDSQPANHMVRWDACAGLNVKFAMAHAEPLEDLLQNRMLAPDDFRAYDIHCEYPLPQIPVWSRPWVKAMMLDGYPVEFRVFVKDSTIIGIASYYLQRALPDTAQIQAYVDACRKAACKLICSMKARGAHPWMPSYQGDLDVADGKIHATMDFLISEDGQALFLEAGPPFGAGAHPCAFMGRTIQGVALAHEELREGE